MKFIIEHIINKHKEITLTAYTVSVCLHANFKLITISSLMVDETVYLSHCILPPVPSLIFLNSSFSLLLTQVCVIIKKKEITQVCVFTK